MGGVLVAGGEPPNAQMGPWMSWRLIQACTVPLPLCSWDRLHHPPYDPNRDKAVKKKEVVIWLCGPGLK